MAVSLNIFVVDDDRDVAEGLADILAVSGHKVHLAYTGEEAARILGEKRFDVALINGRLPGMSGIESFLELHKIQPTTRAVMMTGYTVEQLLTQAVDGGAVRMVQRPMGMEPVISALDAVKPNGLVLVAENDPDFCGNLKTSLGQHHYSAFIAKSGAEALDAVRGGGIDVLVLDLRLPFINGLEVYLELKKQDHNLATILLSGIVSDESGPADIMRDMCVKGVLSKPFDPAQLLTALQTLSEGGEAPPEPEDLFAPSEPPGARPPEPQIVAPEPKQEPTKVRILVVEDDEDVAEGMVEVLRFSDYEVEKALSAEAAKEIAEWFNPQVALIDIQLGRANGLSLINTLKRHRPRLLAVVVTAKADQQSAIDALRSGADDYLNKPMRLEDLFEVLERGFAKLGVSAEAGDGSPEPEFLANVSHELRDPLNAVIGFSEILSEEMLGPLGSEQYVNYASGINQAGQHLTSVIDDMVQPVSDDLPDSGSDTEGFETADGERTDPSDTGPEVVPQPPQAMRDGNQVPGEPAASDPERQVLESAEPQAVAAAPQGTAAMREEALVPQFQATNWGEAVSYEIDLPAQGLTGSEWYELNTEEPTRIDFLHETPPAPNPTPEAAAAAESDSRPDQPRSSNKTLNVSVQIPVKKVI